MVNLTVHGYDGSMRIFTDRSVISVYHIVLALNHSAQQFLLRCERICKHIVCHSLALGYPFGLIERPVDAEVDSALAVFFFGLRERGKVAYEKWTTIPFVVSRQAIELVRDEGEGNIVGLIEPAQYLEQRATKAGMPGRVCWKWRREIR